MTVLALREVSHGHGAGERRVEVLHAVSFDVAAGDNAQRITIR